MSDKTLKETPAPRSTPAPSAERGRTPGGSSRRVLRKATGGSGTLEGAAAESAVDGAQSNSAGAPLPMPTRGPLEARFGQSFADVRIHADGAAADAAQQLNAQAFTVGSDVYFDKGAYQPDTAEGSHLLAHELAHVVQSGDGVAAKSDGISVSSPGDAAEVEADRAADAVVSGQAVGPLGSTPASIVHRDGLGDLNEAVEGNWLLGASKSEVRSRISALSDAEGRRLATDPSQSDLLRRACAVLATASDLCWMFEQVPHFTFDRKAQILTQAHQLNAVSSTQWDTIIDAASDAERADLPSKITVSNAIADTKNTPTALMMFFGHVPHYPVTEKRRLMERTAVTAAMAEGDWALFWDGLDGDAKTALSTTVSCYGLVRAMTLVCSLPVVLMRYGELPEFPILQKIQYLVAAGHIAALSDADWENMVVFTNPQHMLDMREDPAAYGQFLTNAPASVLGGWDWVQCVVTGAAGVDPADLKAGMFQLNTEQQATLRDDATAMRAILGGLGGGVNDIFEVLINLGLEPKWIIFWLDDAGVIGSVTGAQWGQIVGEASHDQMLEIDGWDAVKTLYETHCPEAIRDLRESLPDDAADTADTLTPARIRELYTTLGPVGFLGVVAGDPTTAAANYPKVDRANYLRRTIRALPRGTAMGANAHAHLRTWFFDCGENRLNVLEDMFEARFNVDVEANRAQRREHADDTTRLRRWTVDGLKESWPQLERLPPDQVENNPSLDNFFRNRREGQGNAYYWNNSVVMGLRASDDLTEQSDTNVYREGGQYGEVDPVTGDPINQSPEVPTTVWNATIRHEIGHAVDDALGIMNRWQSSQQCGGWIKHATVGNFVQAIITDYGGIGTAAAPAFNIPAADWPHYQNAMERAVTAGISLDAALTQECANAGAPAPTLPAPDEGPMEVVYTPDRCTPASDGPWYGNDWHTSNGGRNYHRAYGDNSSLYSFNASVRAQKMISDYQWRAPGEWFAECYQVYYVEQEADPTAPVGGVLRSRDPQAANMIANFVDRGYSPQEMRGGARRETPSRVDAPGSSGP